jgi:hypothetical protein
MLSYAQAPGRDGHHIHNMPSLWQADLDAYLGQIVSAPPH